MRAFLLGHLPADQMDRLAIHLESCPGCEAQIQNVSLDDPMVDRLRETNTPMPAVPGLDWKELHERVRQGGYSPVSESSQGPLAKPPVEILLDRYRLILRLGAGGMGTVYLAEDEKLHRRVAVKIPKFAGQTSNQSEALQRFLRETRVAARVHHPNVCTIHDVGEDKGIPFVVMEYVAGRSLAAEMLERGRFDDCREAVRLVIQIARALQAVHDQGIVHRDLKPANILLNPAGEAILTDFGLALPADSSMPLTVEGHIVGTPEYMSPEQVSAPSLIDARSDIFSLGLVLFQMLTGQLPYKGSPQEKVWQRLSGIAPTPAPLRPDLDHRLVDIIRRCLAGRPHERFASAADFATALERWLQGIDPFRRPVDHRSFFVRRFRGVALASLLVVVVGIGVAVIGWRDSEPKSSSVSPTTAGTNATTESVLRPLRVFNLGYLNRAVYSPVDQFLIVSTPMKRILVLDPQNAETLHQLTGHGPCQLWALAISPDGRFLLSGGDDYQIVLWSLSGYKAIQRFKGHANAIKRVSFTPDKKKIVSASDDGTVRTWNTETGTELSRFRFDANDSTIHHLNFSDDGRLFLNGCRDGRLELFDVAKGKLLHSWQGHEDAVSAVAISPDGKQALSGGEKNRIHLWDLQTYVSLAQLDGAEKFATQLVFIPGRQRILAAEHGGAILIWDLNTHQITHRIKEHRFSLSSLAVDPAGKEFMSMSGQGELMFWKLPNP